MSLSLLPSLKDPKLFSVRCRIGSEREAAVSLMNKYFCLKGTKDEINIFSASALDKFPGYIFVEAHRDYHVKEAIKGIKTLNIAKVKPIPVKEVTQVFTIDTSKVPTVEPGQFARIKKGLYKGDLALIDAIDESGKSVKIKLVPRLTSGGVGSEGHEEGDKNGQYEKFGEDGKKMSMRPPKRIFTPNDFPEARPLPYKTNVQVFNYKGLRFENGLLVHKIYINSLELKDIVPTLEEIQMFQKGETKKDRKELLMDRAKKAIEESNQTLSSLQKGDKVKIIQGDLKGINGTVIEVTAEHVKVLPNLDIAKEPIVFLQNEITKLFQPGDNVEILSGKYKGITGTIAKVDGTVAHVISQDNKDDMQVLVNNIKYSSSVNATQRDGATLSVRLMNNRNNIQKHDLIILNDHKTVGVTTSVLKDSVAFVDCEGYARTVPKIQVMNKLNPQGRTKNSYNQDIYPKCIVRVNEGQQKGKSAVVKHVYNDTLFLYDQNLTQNSGIFVERANNCYLEGSSVYDNTKMLARFNNPVLSKAQQELADSNLPPSVISEKQQIKAKQDPKTRRVNFHGQTRVIAKGPYKGFSGRIVSMTEDMVKIELEAINRTISVPLDSLNMDQVEKESYSSNPRRPKYLPSDWKDSNSQECQLSVLHQHSSLQSRLTAGS
jgi:transcription elongation factor SPT5